MKKIFYILFAALVISSGCTKLEPEMYSDMTSSNAYNSESDIDAALVGVYADLAPFPGDGWMYYNGYLVMTTDYTTDMGYSTAAGAPTQMSNFTYDANNRYLKYNWRYMFEVISNVNMLLSKIDAVDMSEEKKNLVKAQARFCRALSYRDATDAWGPVPLLTEVKNPVETIDMPLASVDRVDSLIIEDLKFAIQYLPETWEGKDLARATKGAALTLLGKVYMRKHDYQNAQTYIDQVLQLRDKGVYRLNPDFKNVWSDNNKFDKELIFCILHEATQNGGEITNHFGPRDNREVPHRWQYYAVSLYFWRKYDDNDPRKEFFYYNYEGYAPRDGTTTHGFYYKMPDPGETTPPNDTTKLLVNVATKKYSYEMVSNTYYVGRTISVFRLSDVILCKAEIENALHGPGAALPYLNEIRHRAGAPEYGVDPNFPAPATKEEMADKILDERGFELVFEYKRRPDLIRFGKYAEVCNAYLVSRGMNPVVDDHMLLLPYPLVEAQNNKYMAEANISRLP